MKRCLYTILSVGLLLAPAFAAYQDIPPVNPPAINPAPKTKGSTEKVESTKITTDAGTTKTSTDTLNGEVEQYQPGKWIRISTPGKTEGSRTIDLAGSNVTAQVAPNVKSGDWVSITEKTANNGHKTVRVEHSKPGSHPR